MRRTAAVAALLAAAVLLAGCGDDGPTGTATSSSEGPAAAGFPVTVTHKLGSVTIEREPQRVVALDFPSADAVIALGTIPVGMYEVDYVDGGIQSWTKEALGGERPELLKTTSGFPLEKIAAL